MNDIDRTTPLGLARYAREYFDAALAADDVLGKRDGYEIVAPPPVMFLVAHAIELAIKAYLRYQGASLDEIKDLGHNLLDCWQEAVERGVNEHVLLSDEDMGVLGLEPATKVRFGSVAACRNSSA